MAIKKKVISLIRKITKRNKMESFSNKAMMLSFSNIQNIGKREEQQDSFAISDINDKKLYDKKGALAIIADGMGGLENGKESSSKVIEYIMNYFVKSSFNNSIPVEFRNMIINANKELLKYFSKKDILQSGSTVIAVIIKDFKLFWTSVGDSRIYLYRKDKVYVLNQDHNYCTELYKKVIKGEITSIDVLNHPHRKALTSYMGIEKMSKIDQNIKPFNLNKGDKIILCSDGVYGSLNEKEIEEIMSQDIQNAAANLEQSILNKNMEFQDNFTAILIEIC